MGGFDCELHAETSVKQSIRVDAYNVHSRIHWGDALFASLAYAALLTTTLLPPVTVPPPLSKEQPGVASHLVSWIKKAHDKGPPSKKVQAFLYCSEIWGIFMGFCVLRPENIVLDTGIGCRENFADLGGIRGVWLPVSVSPKIRSFFII